MNHWLYLLIGLSVSLIGSKWLLGLPGALLVGIVLPIMEGLGVATSHSDKMWPAAIATTFLWGLLLWPCYWLNHWIGWPEAIAWLLWFIAGLAVAAMVYGKLV